MKNEQKQDQIQPVEVSEDTLTEVVNDNPNMDESIEIESGKRITIQSFIEKYHRLEEELKEKEDYIKDLEDALIEMANNAYYRGEAIKEMMEHMRKSISSQVGETLRPSKKSGN